MQQPHVISPSFAGSDLLSTLDDVHQPSNLYEPKAISAIMIEASNHPGGLCQGAKLIRNVHAVPRICPAVILCAKVFLGIKDIWIGLTAE